MTYACIRVAEMAYQFETTGAANHERPNGESLDCGENLLYSGPKYIGVNHELKDIPANDALQLWLDSEGHRDNIEGGYRKLVCSQFKAWISSKEGWGIFWVQDF